MDLSFAQTWAATMKSWAGPQLERLIAFELMCFGDFPPRGPSVWEEVYALNRPRRGR